jgi:hypothetical protein
MLGVLFALCGSYAGELGWLYLGEVDDASLGFGNDFLCHDEYITLLKLQVLGLHSCVDNETQVCSWGDLTDTCNG